MDPRLLRFVLINNAIRSLQNHMIRSDSIEYVGEGEPSDDSAEKSDIFFYNTFKNGTVFSIPLNPPPTPVKPVKVDGSFNNLSPLVRFQECIPCSSAMQDNVLSSLEEERVQPAAKLDKIECEIAGDVGGNDGVQCALRESMQSPSGFADMHTFGVHLGKRSRDKFVEDLSLAVDTDNSSGHLLSPACVGVGEKDDTSLGHGVEEESKRSCKSADIQRLGSGMNGLNSLYVALELDPLPPPVLPSSPSTLVPPNFHPYTQSLTEESDKDSLTPSPIDFANVDPSIYDFDTAVLTVDSAEDGGEMDAHASHILPSHITITASSSCTSFSSTHTSSPPSTSTFSLSSTSCSSNSCPQTVTTPLPPLHFPSLPCSNVPMESSQLNHSDFAAISTQHSEVETVSILSADSLVLSSMSAGSPTTANGASCSLEALVHNADLELGSGEELSGEARESINSGSRGTLPASPEPGIELDCSLDDIDHIVNLLMT